METRGFRNLVNRELRRTMATKRKFEKILNLGQEFKRIFPGSTGHQSPEDQEEPTQSIASLSDLEDRFLGQQLCPATTLLVNLQFYDFCRFMFSWRSLPEIKIRK